MEEVGRRARLQMSYEGEDISREIAKHVTSFECVDNASDEADSLKIDLQDRERRWSGPWWPDKGAEISASIECLNLRKRGERMVYPCGVYTIDEISASGPPWKLQLACTSSSVKTSLRREKKTRSWENTSLQDIAQRIAESHDLELVFKASNTSFNRRDQRKQSDLAFLQDLADEAGLQLKIAERKIILFSGESFDKQDPSLTLTPKDVNGWQFTSQAHDLYKACKVGYWGAAEKSFFTYTYTPENAPETGQTLQVNKRVESRAAAEKLAKAELRKKNESEITGSLDLMGDPRLFAGNTLSLEGFHALSGKYFIKQVRHAYGRQGYTCSVSVRSTLEY